MHLPMDAAALGRRNFLGTVALGAGAMASAMTGLDLLRCESVAAELRRRQRRVILLWLAGGASQMETFDPKPGRATGGPYRSIQTSTAGVQISELMPKLAARLDRTAIIRSLNTKIAGHGEAAELMHLGRRNEPGLRYPDLGAVVARQLGQADSPVPDYVNFYTQTEGRNSGLGSAGFFGSRYEPMRLTAGNEPENLVREATISEIDHRERADMQALLNRRFADGRNTTAVGSHLQAYARVQGLMSSQHLFDLEREPENMRRRYGRTQFAEQALIARRLVEAGVPFVKVGRAWWDSHGENFETHLELVTELDHVLTTLLADLDERGLLDHTLVITLSEFGRTPRINQGLGRDHFAAAWSCSLSGAGIRGGTVYGKTDDDGNTVVDGEVNAASLFATIYEALGIDPYQEFHVGPRPVPLTEFDSTVVSEVLA